MTNPSEPEQPVGDVAILERPREVVQQQPEWLCIVWDDPVNLMSYVTYVFTTYFGYARDEAERLMLQVHTDGRSVVARGSREKIERDVKAMHEYGLWATMESDA